MDLVEAAVPTETIVVIVVIVVVEAPTEATTIRIEVEPKAAMQAMVAQTSDKPSSPR